MRRIEAVYIHHTATSRDTTVAEIDAMHRSRGFAGIGYHVLVLPDGNLEWGRPLEKVGAHTKYHNWRSVGVGVIGNNMVPGEEWTRGQWLTLWAVLRALDAWYGPLELHGHLEARPTACPGLVVDWRAFLELDAEAVLHQQFSTYPVPDDG